MRGDCHNVWPHHCPEVYSGGVGITGERDPETDGKRHIFMASNSCNGTMTANGATVIVNMHCARKPLIDDPFDWIC